ncbi:chemotaxis protein CheW [Vibrio sp. ZSDE26]|uniref:Chemotaxis protein CheW n=1 Tax=Vibrio amylolyticus TaxID=2847292 RepID=A0A9X1XGJ4_9VIBR|nr:chemotaxis protein CheW [Vibrio amylolyticus]MCK6262682.1 chemotaxis protein CheW [Vibrio amylolyticus]
MSNASLISSEQALDEYFTALLDDEEISLTELTDADSIDASTDDVALTPELQPQEEKSLYQVQREEIVAPNLEDVERLLQQLEASNPVAELDLEEILEENTRQIAEEKKSLLQDEIEEVQDWPVDDVVAEEQIDLSDSTPVAQDLETTLTDAIQEETHLPEEQVQAFTQEPDITIPDVEVEESVELETQTGGSGLDVWQSTKRSEDFQVLYFDVNGVMFAVPLDELGGIHRLAELSHLIGRPNWYLGLQTSKENQLDVVDTAQWVMSEKLSDDSHKEQYQYIVMLGESMWGLASTELKGTESLNTDKVRWRETAGKRPWLAGMVKEKMCALIHVEALIAMLNAGLDVKALNK